MSPIDPTTSSDARSSQPSGRLIVVSNRLPVQRVRTDEGDAGWRLSPGGLVSALEPILGARGGAWVGWPGDADDVPDDGSMSYRGIDLHPVAVSEDELRDYYDGFCNRTIWPLFHDCIRSPSYQRSWWDAYQRVNQRFAEAALAVAGPDDVIWVQDYQLQLVPGLIRAAAPDARIGFFLHIPHPPVQLLAQIPWRRELIEGLAAADVVGFQTEESARNFERARERFARTPSRTWSRVGERSGVATAGDMSGHAKALPISIDVGRFETMARQPAVREHAERIRAELGGRKLVLGVDRLDYSKGIDQRLLAFESLLARDPELADEVTLVQVAVPTRENVPDYRALRHRIEHLVGRINGRFGRPGRTPVHCMCRSLPPEELTAHYLAADVLAVTPLRDGMNLVAKEFVAARVDGGGVLILSEFAGAADELRRALVVNPHDEDALAAAIAQAVRFPEHEARRRMREMREHVRCHDVHEWADAFLAALDDAVDRRTKDEGIGARTAGTLARQRRRRVIGSRALSDPSTVRTGTS